MNINYFQEVLLPLHIKLQGLYREKCGDLRDGDTIYWNDELSILSDNDKYKIRYLNEKIHETMPRAVFIPRTIDDSSPEAQKRSLIGMFTPNTLIYIKPVFGWAKGPSGPVEMDNTTSSIHVLHSGEWGCKIVGVDDPFIGSSPTHAILKALASQEGIEV